MRKILGVCLLVLLLTVPAVAGEIPNWPPTPPQPANAVQEPMVTQETNDVAKDDLTQTALDLLALLASLL
jgi:hypothetical protein